MALNKNERKALELAWWQIQTAQSSRICYALSAIGRKDQKLLYATIRLRLYITDALEPFTLFEDWQVANGFGHRSDEQIRRDRLAWIDWMLDQPIIDE